MGILDKVTKGKIEKPYFVLLYGEPGVGKSSWAEKAPSPIYLCSEDGSDELNVTRLRLQSLDELKASLNELVENQDYKTVVIDTIDGFEKMITDAVVSEHRKKSIEEFGYGKGYAYALDHWHEVVGLLEQVAKTKNVILLAHSQIKPFNDPQLSDPYDTYQIKMNQKAAELLRDKVSTVLFACYDTVLDAEKGKKAKAYGEGIRIVYTEKRPSFLAKNRLGLPFKMPLDFAEFDKAARNHAPKDPTEMIKFIEENISALDEKVREAAKAHFEKNKDNPQVLAAIENRIKSILSAKTA